MRIMTVDELRQYSSKMGDIPFDIDQVGQFLFVWMVTPDAGDRRGNWVFDILGDLDANVAAKWKRSVGTRQQELVYILKVPITSFLFPPFPKGTNLKYDHNVLYVKVRKSRWENNDEHWIRTFGGEIIDFDLPQTDYKILKTKLEVSIQNGLFELVTRPDEEIGELDPEMAPAESYDLSLESENGWREHLQILAKVIAGKFYRGVLREMEIAVGEDEIPWDTPPENIRIDSAKDPCKIS